MADYFKYMWTIAVLVLLNPLCSMVDLVMGQQQQQQQQRPPPPLPQHVPPDRDVNSSRTTLELSIPRRRGSKDVVAVVDRQRRRRGEEEDDDDGGGGGVDSVMTAAVDVGAEEYNNKHRVVICFLTRNHPAPTRVYAHQIYQIQKYSTSFEGLEFDYKLLYNNENSDTTSMLRTIVANGTDCSAYFGPLSSSLALGIGPLIDAIHMDAASGSAELSDTTRFPYYNRINAVQAPTKVMAKTILYFNWSVVNILCTDETFGRSMSQTLVEVLNNGGGGDHSTTNTTTTTRVGIQHCISSNPTKEEVRDALLQVSSDDPESSSRIIVLAVNPIVEAWKNPDYGLLKQIQEMNIHHSRVLFLPSGQVCEETTNLTYAFCLDGLLDTDAFQPIKQDYETNAPFEEYNISFRQAGVDMSNLNFDPWDSLIPHLAYDAIHFFMHAYGYAYQRNTSGFDPYDYPTMLQALRNYSMEGMTGLLELDENGDRKTENLYNVYSLGNTTDERKVILNNRHIQINPVGDGPIIWYDGSTDIPLATFESNIDDDRDIDTIYETNRQAIWIMVTVFVVLVVIVSILIVRMKQRVRKLSYAPTKGPLAVAFTDIESSTKLWRRDPVAMSKSLQIHNMLIRQNISKHHGYEVKTVGDAFMIATPTVEQMVRIAVDTQRDFANYPNWPSPKDVPIKIRFGIHYSPDLEVVFDEVSKGYDYFGNAVNQAARIESKCVGRQILISSSSLAASAAADQDDFTKTKETLEKELNVTWEAGNMYQLKGIDKPVELCQISYDPSIVYEDDDKKTYDAESLLEGGGSTAAYTASSTTDVPLGSIALTTSSKSDIPRDLFLDHPKNLNVHSAEFEIYDQDDPFFQMEDDDEASMEQLYMVILEGFFATALNDKDTKSRFDWMAKTLITDLNPRASTSDGDKLHGLARRLLMMVDEERVKWACTRIAKEKGYTRIKQPRQRSGDANKSQQEEHPI